MSFLEALEIIQGDWTKEITDGEIVLSWGIPSGWNDDDPDGGPCLRIHEGSYALKILPSTGFFEREWEVVK